ncbi:DoxX family protein [Polluticoccus soli]|uniref:DoxX family protein n=1 Tax=Polluticoccus soli TaxID=3034150 RepID=UPI0023E0B8D0|nr:DoxX family protein [Flavipsychrobacter sp. JY13-12]
MTKTNKIIYWIATLWLSLGMTSTGIVQLLRMKGEVEFILDLGYPDYFLTLLGLTKLLAVVAILIPRFPLLKEWAYAGLFFMMSGALYSHIAHHNTIKEIAPVMLLLLLISVSWYFRPMDRKLISVNFSK